MTDNNLLYLIEPILTKTLLFGINSFKIITNSNVLNATVNIFCLLKDYINRFFNEFTESCRNVATSGSGIKLNFLNRT